MDAELNVLVSDFGLSRDVYHSNYYRLTHKALLPIKWMAPESLRDRIYNEKTDVVSYRILYAHLIINLGGGKVVAG